MAEISLKARPQPHLHPLSRLPFRLPLPGTPYITEIQALRDGLNFLDQSEADRKDTSVDSNMKKAAVLIPICLQDGIPSILFTLRALNMRTHPSEVCFPGGKWDPTDDSLLQTALREADEEVGITADAVQVVSPLAPVSHRQRLQVFPYVGYINCSLAWSPATSRSLPSPLTLKVNPDEVATCFTIPIADLLSRDGILRWESSEYSPDPIPRFCTPAGIPADIHGLTAYVLYQTLKVWLPHHLSIPSNSDNVLLLPQLPSHYSLSFYQISSPPSTLPLP